MNQEFIAEYERLVAEFVRLRAKIDSICGLYVSKNTPDELVLDGPPASTDEVIGERPREVLVKIGSKTLNSVSLGWGKYAGVVMQWGASSFSSAASAVAMPEVYSATGSDVLLINIFGGNELSNGVYARGWFSGSCAVGNETYPVVMIARMPDGVHFTGLAKQNGGTNGDATTIADWKYDVYPLWDTGYTRKLNSTALSVECGIARSVKGPVVQAADGTKCELYYDTDGTIKLWNIPEVHGTGGC